MKLSKWEGAVILLAAVLLAFAAGWFLRGGGAAEPLRVETQRKLTVTVTAYPAPTEEPEERRVNINTAGAEELMTLPGIGEKRAADIIEEREANGPFDIPEDITRVRGIGEETLAELLDKITVEDQEENADGLSEEDLGGSEEEERKKPPEGLPEEDPDGAPAEDGEKRTGEEEP